MNRKEIEAILISPPSNWMHKDIPYPPLGISYLSAVGKQEGIQTKVVDGQFPKEYRRELSELASLGQPCLVGISSTFLQLPEAIKAAQIIKTGNPQAVTVFGGAGPNCLSPKDFFSLAGKNVDLVCLGEGEETWREILKKFLGATSESERSNSGYLFENTKGTVIGTEGKVLMNPARGLIEDIDSLPMPDLEAVRVRKYLETWKKNSGITSMTIFPSRGCPFGCMFCDKSIFGRSFRFHSPGRIVDEMERLVREYGPIDDIFFFDDNLSTRKEILNEVCQEILRRNLKVSWCCQARVDTVDEEILKHMKEAGCSDIYFGVETASQRLLDFLKKGITIQAAERSISLCREAGIAPGCFLMVGIPGEGEEDIQELARFITRNRLAYIGLSILTPFPGTELYQKTQHLIKPELRIGPNLLHPDSFSHWDDTRSSIYQEGVFSVNPKTAIKYLESVFEEMLKREKVNYDPSQFVKDR